MSEKHSAVPVYLIIPLLLVMLFAAVPAFAQSWAGRGRLKGVITNKLGEPVEGAQVWLRKGFESIDPASPGDGPRPLATNKNGRWAIVGLARGTWQMLILKEDFALHEAHVSVNEYDDSQFIVVRLVVQNTAATALARGNELNRASKYPEARAEYEKAIVNLAPENHPPIRRAIARTYYQENRPEKAVEVLEQDLAINPGDEESLSLVINLLVGQGKEKEAEVYMAKLADPSSLLITGIRYYNDGMLTEALDELNKAMKLYPNLPDVYYYRGLVFLGSNKTDEARADFRKLIELDPNHANADEVREMLEAI